MPSAVRRSFFTSFLIFIAVALYHKKAVLPQISMIINHILTNLWVMERFLGLKYNVEGEKGKPGKIIIKGTGLSFSS